ncbi:inositol phosphorylceramide synthase [Gordonia sp. TBRC 11910]|uniref:Inositol phosphorylceramide synthase n=1 Tax=Gordonia asplenii TaxID=2725283 RepID=A0A848L2Q2_9ACTN|nr:phosphatase PAP2 family protein [Gordonia asplenii]NMO04777.1 inositol phosphorylceramide synthase [Gordonia asplenii]
MTELRKSRRWLRALVFVGYLVALGIVIATKGVPLERLYQAAWLLGGIVAFRIDRPLRSHLRVLVDWIPLIAALVAYDFSRAAATSIGMPLQIETPINIDRALFGGVLPTVWLQQHLLPADGALPWWSFLTAFIYTTHLVVPWVLAAVLYVYSRGAWRRYMTTVVVLSFLGLLTYVLLPQAPPWYAAEHHAIAQRVGRVAGFGFGLVPIDTSTGWLEANSNPVAAMPSLHAAFTIVVVVALWPFVTNRVARAVLVLFPVAMAFTLVYGGEHYVIDVLVGWVYAGVAIWLTVAGERMWARWRANRIVDDAAAVESHEAVALAE